MTGDRPNNPRRDAEAKLIEKAVRDAAFRAELLRDPRAAIERHLSASTGTAVHLPAHMKVVVHEETADTFHLVLPPASAATGELSDAELTHAAGGLELPFPSDYTAACK